MSYQPWKYKENKVINEVLKPPFQLNTQNLISPLQFTIYRMADLSRIEILFKMEDKIKVSKRNLCFLQKHKYKSIFLYTMFLCHLIYTLITSFSITYLNRCFSNFSLTCLKRKKLVFEINCWQLRTKSLVSLDPYILLFIKILTSQLTSCL